ncbi:oligogalacturonate-specific porin KdgM family protein [Edwardsiella tarda]|uniref:Uncharacterized protein n=3 Tax=Edwardsiella tarda TaxID=636 RepID=A0A2A7U109_EDWTA|nr:oligogalacturonate-specific porin KdgM family protein [Edwardsiella tarda]AKH88458.1 oligogalacturonate-specific porin KdgM family protein [Edwardsiella tarda]ATI65056.1 hypothetical protein CPU03_12840 [Edwardsiella tarda]EFE22002.1 oligogalacturonate-specific porin protein KdgM [Edwardsiella tarda ATCC 23685]PEH72019.1 hypothetical protein CRM76_08855 [Edwardsiella tarda]UAL55883.1 oligogalacturonate-specific porin KdgM family protein [Edwardsiella tarda]
MNKLIYLAALPCLFSASQSWANNYKTSVEYRHEYREGVKKHSDRFKVFLDTGNHIGFEFDARYGNHDDQAYDQMYLNGSELNVFYYTDLNKNTLLLAGNSFDFTSEGLVFIPFVRLNYTFDNGFYIHGRYKWKLWDYSMKGVDQQPYHSKIQEFDTFIGYKWGQWNFQYQLDLMREMSANGQPLYNGKKWDYANNFRVVYAIDANWRPFIEIGDIKESRDSDRRQGRYRIGLKYTW